MPASPLPPAAPGTPLGELLVRLRCGAGLTQADLARRAGLSERALRSLERGATVRPRPESLRVIGEALGLGAHQLESLLAAAHETPAAPVAGPPPGQDLSPLIGRAAETAAVFRRTMHGPQRLITITGPGGVGKSRLAAEVARLVAHRAGLEVRTADLSSLGDAGLVGEVLAEVSGAGGRSRLDPVTRTAAVVGRRRLLLVLDRFEQVRSAAGVVRELLARCPGLTVVATSQVPLAVADEYEVRLRPLAVPGPDAHHDLSALREVPSVALLLHRAAAVRPELRLTPGVAPAVAEICRAVEGLPLAVELAAARLRLLSPAELAARLDHPLTMLGDGPPSLPERHRSLRSTIAATVEVVGEQARELFVRLEPFVAGAELTDLEAVADAAGHDPAWMLRALTDLVQADLVRVSDADGASRYRLPDAVRAYAAEQLARRPDGTAVREVAARRFLERLTRADPAARPAPADDDNVRAAVAWARRQRPALLTSAVVDGFYELCESRGRFAEGRATLTTVGGSGAPGAAAALLRAARLSQYLADLDEADRLAALGHRLLPPGHGGRRGTASLLRGSIAAERGDGPAAVRHTTDALRQGRRTGDLSLVGRAYNNLAAFAYEQGDLDGSERHLHRALHAKEAARAPALDLGRTLMNCGEQALYRGDLTVARRRGAQAAETLDRAGHVRLRAIAHTTAALGHLTDPAGDAGTAEQWMSRAVASLDAFGEDAAMRGFVQGRAGLVAYATGRAAESAALFRAGAPAMLGGHVSRDIPHLLELYALVTAPAAPCLAARLLALAAAARLHLHITLPPSHAGTAAADRCRRDLGEPRFDRERAVAPDLDRIGIDAVLRDLTPVPRRSART